MARWMRIYGSKKFVVYSYLDVWVQLMLLSNNSLDSQVRVKKKLFSSSCCYLNRQNKYSSFNFILCMRVYPQMFRCLLWAFFLSLSFFKFAYIRYAIWMNKERKSVKRMLNNLHILPKIGILSFHLVRTPTSISRWRAYWKFSRVIVTRLWVKF